MGMSLLQDPPSEVLAFSLQLFIPLRKCHFLQAFPELLWTLFRAPLRVSTASSCFVGLHRPQSLFYFLSPRYFWSEFWWSSLFFPSHAQIILLLLSGFFCFVLSCFPSHSSSSWLLSILPWNFSLLLKVAKKSQQTTITTKTHCDLRSAQHESDMDLLLFCQRRCYFMMCSSSVSLYSCVYQLHSEPTHSCSVVAAVPFCYGYTSCSRNAWFWEMLSQQQVLLV